MEDLYTIIFTVLLCGALASLIWLITYFFNRVNSILVNKVKQHSKVLDELEEFNISTFYYDVEGVHINRKHYDNKSNFNKVELAYIMAADLRDNADYYYEVCDKIKKNRETYEIYKDKVDQLHACLVQKESEEVKLSYLYKFIEKKAVQKNVLKPTLDYVYTVIATYSSPKGQVNLSKEETFNLENMYSCLESVSRSRLDRNTYKNLSKVERAEVSDSIRYDIMARDGFKCVICGASAKDGAHLHVDHIIPISKGGKSVPGNLRTLCERCNVGKSDKIENVGEKAPQKSQEVILCPQCGGELIIRTGPYGKFYGCSNYPSCRYTKNISN